jgi:hypothetical protein
LSVVISSITTPVSNAHYVARQTGARTAARDRGEEPAELCGKSAHGVGFAWAVGPLYQRCMPNGCAVRKEAMQLRHRRKRRRHERLHGLPHVLERHRAIPHDELWMHAKSDTKRSVEI